MADTPSQPDTPPNPETTPAWTPDPGRWERGDWEYRPGDWQNDATKDAPWEDPSILRRRIGTADELAAVADAIVRGQEYRKLHPQESSTPFDITEDDPDGNERVIVGKIGGSRNRGHGLGQHVVVENLKALIVAVQDHPAVKMAKVNAEEDTDGFLRVHRRWVEDREANELSKEAEPTKLRLWHSVVAQAAVAGLDIGVTFGPEARFAGNAQFAKARFAGDAGFERAHFTGVARFDGARFAGVVRFRDTRFAGVSQFDEARFAGVAEFHGARFAGVARFGEARFTGVAEFHGARFAGAARLGGARFAGDARFKRVRFARYALFDKAVFKGSVVFTSAQFGDEAHFRQAQFASTALFNQARFVGDAWFTNIRVHRNATLVFSVTRFKQSCHFDDEQQSDEPHIQGKLAFIDATLDERLTFHNTQFGEHARLKFTRFLARGGATIELSEDQLGLTRPQLADQPLLWIVVRPWRWRWLRNYFAFDRSRTIMEGGDSNDPESILRAVDDYQLLAANYARQPAREKEEDNCRWLAHELRRRAAWCPMKERWAPTKALWVQAGNEVLSFIQTPMDRASSRLLHGRTEGPLLWYLEYIALIWSCVIAYSTFARRIASAAWGAVRFALTWSFARDGVWEWGIKRTAVGYLLQPHRIAITGILLLVGCAIVYGVWAGEDTLSFNHDSLSPPAGFWGRAIFGVFFSLTTFVTLGYGDYAPTGWFKLVTGFEGLFGVTLLALFTVAWGRKMVR